MLRLLPHTAIAPIVSAAPALAAPARGELLVATRVVTLSRAQVAERVQAYGLPAAPASSRTAPDYLGLGDGPGLHPFMHLASEASASLDLLPAERAHRTYYLSYAMFAWHHFGSTVAATPQVLAFFDALQGEGDE